MKRRIPKFLVPFAMLLGMLAPANWGREYQQEFAAIYPDLAKQEGVTLYPFFMDGIIQPDGTADRTLLQGDGLHPTEAGAALIVQRLMPVLLPPPWRTPRCSLDCAAPLSNRCAAGASGW